MGFRTTLVLLVLVGAVLAVWQMTDEGPIERKETVSENVLPEILRKAVRLEIERKNGGRFVFEQRPDGWFMVEPVADLASVGRLSAIATSYDSAQMELAFGDREPTEEEVVDAGVDEPTFVFTVVYPGDAPGEERPTVIEVGKPGPLNKDLYLRRDGKIWLGALDLASVLLFTTEDMRERLVFRNNADSAMRLTASQGVPDSDDVETMILDKTSGQWRMTAPFDSRVDPVMGSRFVQTLLGLRAATFLSGSVNIPLDAQGDPRSPDITVTVDGALRDHVRLWVVDGGVFGVAEGRPEAFAIESSKFLGIFGGAVQRLRARFLIPFSLSDLTRFTLDGPSFDQPVGFQQTPQRGFRMISPMTVESNPTPVQEFLAKLRELHAVQFVDEDWQQEKFGLVQGFYRLTVEGLPGRAQGKTTLRFGADAPDGKTVYCRREDETQVVQVPKGVADALRRPWIDYVGRGVLSQSVSPMRIELRGPDKELRFGRDQGSWRNEQSQKLFEGDDKLAMMEFVEAFKEIKARAVVGVDTVKAEAVIEVRMMRNATDVFQIVEFRLVDLGGKDARAYISLPDRGQVLYETSKALRDDLLWLWNQG